MHFKVIIFLAIFLQLRPETGTASDLPLAIIQRAKSVTICQSYFDELIPKIHGEYVISGDLIVGHMRDSSEIAHFGGLKEDESEFIPEILKHLSLESNNYSGFVADVAHELRQMLATKEVVIVLDRGAPTLPEVIQKMNRQKNSYLATAQQFTHPFVLDQAFIYDVLHKTPNAKHIKDLIKVVADRYNVPDAPLSFYMRVPVGARDQETTWFTMFLSVAAMKARFEQMQLWKHANILLSQRHEPVDHFFEKYTEQTAAGPLINTNFLSFLVPADTLLTLLVMPNNLPPEVMKQLLWTGYLTSMDMVVKSESNPDERKKVEKMLSDLHIDRDHPFEFVDDFEAEVKRTVEKASSH